MKIVRSSELPWGPSLQKGKYGNRRKELAGTAKLGCGLWELQPGKKSFPLHAHLITEEALFVVSGRAKVRTPDGETAIGPGDFVHFEAGGPAHQLINEGPEPMIYLAVSVHESGDMVLYPETGKFAAAHGRPPTGKRWVFSEKNQVDYFAGDEDAET